MTGVFHDIQIALDTVLSNTPNMPLIAWENVEFVTEFGSSFLRPTLIPAKSVLVTLDGSEEHKGIYQIDIFTQAGKGVGEAMILADEIYNSYSGKTLKTNTSTIWIMNIGIGKGEKEEAWDHHFVEINYLCIA